MKLPLSDDQRRALDLHLDGIELEDPETQKVYFLADAELHRQATEALRQHEDVAAIQRGIEDMEAGRGALLTKPTSRCVRNLVFHLARNDDASRHHSRLSVARLQTQRSLVGGASFAVASAPLV